MRPRRWIVFAGGLLVGLLSMAQGAGAVGLQPVGSFNDPIYVTSPPNDPRLFVVERAGYIQVLHDGVKSQFLDIHTLTTVDQGVRGLLSMAFDPNYATNGLFYVFYTGNATNDDIHIDEFHVSSDPNVANASSRREVLTFPQPVNPPDFETAGGQLEFGKDGLLYISTGDGGNSSTAPDLTSLNGKILRINPHVNGANPYSIPADNPYATAPPPNHHGIWASGLRNPWRFSFDAVTGDLVIADVGEALAEEIDFAPAAGGLGKAANFGWPACEGFAGNCPGDTAPVFAYPHSDPGGDAAFGCAIIGGYVYRGTQIPDLYGRYVYTDNCRGELRSIQLGLPLAGGDRAESAPGALAGPQSLGEDASCNLYVTSGNAVEKIVGSTSGASSCSATPPSSGSAATTKPAARKCKKHKKKKHHRAAAAKKHKKCKKHHKSKKK